MDTEHLLDRLLDSSQPAPAPAEVLACLKEKPWFYLLALAWLRRTAAEGMLFDPETRRQISRFAALSMPLNSARSMYVLNDLVYGDETDENFYPADPVPEPPSTAQAIDIFLDTYARPSDTDRETQVLEQMIFNPVADYASMLAQEEQNSLPPENDAESGSNDDLLNRFILSARQNSQAPSHEVADKPLVTPPPIPAVNVAADALSPQDDTTFSESLAKIYIKRKNYSGAHEIISKLNLKFPEKSVYFAVQLRFLDKLMLNERLKARQKPLV